MIDLNALFQKINETCFGGELIPLHLSYNSRLRSAAGRFFPGQKQWFRNHKIVSEVPPRIDIATYLSQLPEGKKHIEDTLKHELIHYWLWSQKKPYGHTPLFKAKMIEIGATRYNPVPMTRPPKFLYACPHCEKEFRAKRRMRAKACLSCCNQHSNGKYDVRFKLYLKEVAPLPPQKPLSVEKNLNMKPTLESNETKEIKHFSGEFLKNLGFLILVFSLGNTFASDFSKTQKLIATNLQKTNAQKVWIQMSSGALSCEDPKESSHLKEHEELLKRQNIKIFESKNGNDGKMHAQMCGIPKGDQHQFLILKKDLKKAEKNGFQLMTGAPSSP